MAQRDAIVAMEQQRVHAGDDDDSDSVAERFCEEASIGSPFPPLMDHITMASLG